MTRLSTTARRRIEAGLGQEVSCGLADFLHSGEGSLAQTYPHREAADAALMLWSTRAANTTITGVRIEGVEDLVEALRSLPPDTVLERYDHQHNRALLTIYREFDSKRPIGYQFIHTPEPAVESFHLRLGLVPPDTVHDSTPGRELTGKAEVRSLSQVGASNREEIDHG